MCGLAGFWSTRGDVARRSRDILEAMASSIKHRGPDDAGCWWDKEAGFGLAHRRLSIIDHSRHGRQPMHSASGRFVIAYNGELYNFEDLRRRLRTQFRSLAFRGRTDTEVLLEAIAHWGLETALSRANGMFAFALWDKQERTLVLARDRIGIKPLYYGKVGPDLVFSSELRALREYPGFSGRIDRDALDLFVRHATVPSPHCIFQGVHKLQPGTFLRLKSPDQSWKPITYWCPWQKRYAGLADELDFDDPAVVAEFDELLGDAVQRRTIADVPLGAFLSGGIDSSLVVALMQKYSTKPTKTFTIGFQSERFDEAPHARAVAEALGTDHTELYVTDEEVLQVAQRVPQIADEPLGDSSLLPTFLVSQLARQEVTVALSGDGGDELFGGYRHYHMGHEWERRVGWLPRQIRHHGGTLLACSGTAARRLTADVDLPTRVRHQFDRASYLGGMVAATGRDPMALYWQIFRYWNDTKALVRGARRPGLRLEKRLATAGKGPLGQLNGMMFADTLLYLPDVLLTKLDRCSMNVSLEARVPLLDHRVVEWAWRVGAADKLDGRKGKIPLRKILYQYVDPELIERPKQGFSVPLAQWLRGPLRDRVEELLRPQRLHKEGYFNVTALRRRWTDHIEEKADWEHDLWNVIVFQMWNEATG